MGTCQDSDGAGKHDSLGEECTHMDGLEIPLHATFRATQFEHGVWRLHFSFFARQKLQDTGS